MNKAELDREINRTPNGKHRMELLRKGWEMADANKDYNGQMYYRLEYMYDAFFYEDELEGYVIFPEILRLHDQRVKEYGYDGKTYDVLWKYKWILENAASFYQISIQQYEMFWQDCKKRYMQNNYSLRPLYQHRVVFYDNIDKRIAEEAYREFLNCERDSMSDCHACERSLEVDYFLGRGEIGKAVNKAAPLIDGELRCAEQPECTLASFLRYYNEKILEGESDYIEPASELAETLRKAIDRKGIATFHIPDVFMFYGLANPTKALNYFKKQWPFFEEHRVPRDRFWFGIATLCFLRNLKDKKTYKMTLDSAYPFYNEKNTYNVEELINYYKTKTLEIVEKMDGRNGTTYFYDTFCKLVPWVK